MKKINIILIVVAIFVFSTLFFVLDEKGNSGTFLEESQEEVKDNGEKQTENSKEEESNVDPEKERGDRKEIVLGKVAIVIDDLGYDPELNNKIEAIDAPLTLAILPFLSDTGTAIDRFKNKEARELILHLPLQPISEDVWEEKMAMVDMSQEEIAAFLSEALDEMKGEVKGLNNHKGSKFTSDPLSMRWLLEEIKERDLFFVDSRTLGQSVGYSLAQEMDIKTAERDIFLDVKDDPEEIREKLKELEEMAKKEGQAIAIGHHKENTIQVLLEELPAMEERGIQFVTVSELLE
ncbi:MAG: divergent polysaccharide deacetylase family protein [Candidatus Paceibacterota bacterium]